MKIFWKTVCWIIIVILFLFTLVNGILLWKNVVYGEDVPDFKSYIPIIMQTNSMQPLLRYHDLIIDEKIVTEENLNVGDVISYKYGDKIITNRIMKIAIKDGRKKYLMKGDGEDYYTAIITFDNMRGKYIFTIPYVGEIIEFTRTPIGIVISLFILAVPFILFDVIVRNKKIKEIEKLEANCRKTIASREKIVKDKEKRTNLNKQ